MIEDSSNIHWILPIVGIFLAFLTKKGCYKDINTLLAGLLVFIFGYEVHIIDGGYLDGPWHDAFLFSVYGVFSYLFYKTVGKRQLILSLVGVALSAGYGLTYLYSNWMGFDFNPKDFYYTESFITLTILQLIVASDGVAWTALYKKMGGHDELRHSHNDSSLHNHNRRND
jgi:hypothetical protein